MKKIHKIFIYKILLFILSGYSFIMLADNFLPERVSTDTITGKYTYNFRKYGTATTYTIKTTHSQFETKNDFYYDVNDSFPVTLYTSPVLRLVKKVEGMSTEQSQHKIESIAQQTLFNTFWAFPLFIFVLSTLGLFVRNEQADGMFLGVSIFFLAVLCFTILPYMY